MKNCLSIFPSFVFVLLMVTFVGGGPAFGQESHASKVARVLNDSGLTFTKQSATVWSVPFEGKKLKDITVILSVSDDLLTVFSLIAEKKDLKLTPEILQKLLRSNEDFDRVKIGIDKDGDVFARIDLTIRVLDAAELKTNVEQVSAAADEVFDYLKPVLVKKK